MFKLEIINNRLRNPFPKKEIESLGFIVTVSKINVFEELIMISAETTDNPVSLAYTLGTYVESLKQN
jgi:hypothetical protein